MRRRATLVAVALCGFASPVAAQREGVTVTSRAPAHVAVTVYRNPYRTRGAAVDLRYLGGFALVTETRTVRLPKGAAVLRFEGVAEGIVPVSAIIDGLPGGTVEKNRDARLLSPASLVDGSLGRQVTLTRTDKATGQRRAEQATIVAGPEPGIVMKTANGIETLRCAGFPESLKFASVPAGLSAKPVLSVSTVTPSARTATVTLSYLTSGFDWSASYVATIAPDGRTLDLFAWLTLANGNPEAFVDADVQAVAGRLNRTATREFARAVSALQLRCYPLGTTTSDLREEEIETNDIVVTASRVMAPMAMMAPPAPPPPPPPPPPPEDLGDLKLYRVPERVTVAPRGQKQVALLSRAAVPFERVYRLTLYPGQTLVAAPTQIVLRLRNTKDKGLGLALPAGSTALYADRAGERLLVGMGTIADTAEGQSLRIGSGVSRQVLVEQTTDAPAKQSTIAVSNANNFPVTVEVPIGAAGYKVEAYEGALRQVDGISTWTVTVPPHGRETLLYRY